MALDPSYMISPNLQEYYVDKDTGLPLAGGEVYYYKDIERSTLKPVYRLSGAPGSYEYVALPNPVPLSGVGTTTDGSGNDIRVYYYPYDDDGNLELYYIVPKSSEGVTQFTRQAWPNVVQEGDQSVYTYNFVRNPTFFSWSNLPSGVTEFANVKTGSVNSTDFFVDDWTYRQSNASSNIVISQGTFLPGDDNVPGNPPHYLIYECKSVGAGGDTYNQFQQYFKNVQTLNSKNVSFSVWINQATGAAGTFSATLTQYFGSGGSADVVTTLTSSLLTVGSWVEYKGTALLPSITGKTIGTNSALILSLNMPASQTAKVYIGPVRLEDGTEITGSQEISNDDHQRNTNAFTLYPPFSTGDVKMTIKTTADTGWLMMNDQTIGNPTSSATNTGWSYYALYSLIWSNIASTIYAPIYTSAGVITTYGASAKEDWEANKRLSLTKALGRVFAGANPGPTSIVRKVFTASNDGNLLLTINDTQSIYTGTTVQVSNSGGALPGGLSAATNYYVIIATGTTFYLALSLADALAGTKIGWGGSAGSGTNTVVTENSPRILGEYLGEDSHANTIGETPNHDHPGSHAWDEQSAQSGGTDVIPSVEAGHFSTPPIFIAPQGGSAAHNNIQPTTYMNVMIKL